MFGAILKATNSSFKKGMPFCRSIYVKKDMKLLAFIFEQPSYFSLINFIKRTMQGNIQCILCTLSFSFRGYDRSYSILCT